MHFQNYCVCMSLWADFSSLPHTVLGLLLKGGVSCYKKLAMSFAWCGREMIVKGREKKGRLRREAHQRFSQKASLIICTVAISQESQRCGSIIISIITDGEIEAQICPRPYISRIQVYCDPQSRFHLLDHVGLTIDGPGKTLDLNLPNGP